MQKNRRKRQEVKKSRATVQRLVVYGYDVHIVCCSFVAPILCFVLIFCFALQGVNPRRHVPSASEKRIMERILQDNLQDLLVRHTRWRQGFRRSLPTTSPSTGIQEHRGREIRPPFPMKQASMNSQPAGHASVPRRCSQLRPNQRAWPSRQSQSPLPPLPSAGSRSSWRGQGQ